MSFEIFVQGFSGGDACELDGDDLLAAIDEA